MSRMVTDGCVSKPTYPTRLAARSAQPKMRVYRCPLCERWHVRSRISRRQAR